MSKYDIREPLAWRIRCWLTRHVLCPYHRTRPHHQDGRHRTVQEESLLMATNEENAHEIIKQCLVEAKEANPPLFPSELAVRIVACLAEVQLIAEEYEHGGDCKWGGS